MLLIAGPAVGVVQDAPDRGFASTALLTLLAAAPPLIAVALVIFGRALTAAGVLTGAGLLSVGRALVDLQFIQDGLQVSRPELLVPTSLAELVPATGLWLLVGGHLATGAAGLLAAGRAGATPGSAYGLELDSRPTGTGPTDATYSAPAYPAAANGPGNGAGWPSGAGEASDGPDERRTSEKTRGRAMGWALGFATIAAVGLVMPPFRSENAFQLGHDLIGSPTLVRVGLLLIVAAVVGGCVFAAGSARPAVARGVILGVLLATAAVTLPQIVAGLTVERLSPDVGPYLALASLLLLTILIFVLRGTVMTTGEGGDTELQLETGRVHLVTGVLGVLAGVAALIGAVGPQLVVDGLAEPESYANRQLIPVGVLVAALGAALLANRWAAAVRPAFVVSLGAVVLVGTATLDAAFTGAGISDTVHIGAGVWFAAASMLIAAAAAISAAVAGSAERDDVDLTERTTHLSVAAPAGAAILFSVGAFGFPMIAAPDFVAPGIWSDFRLASWGLVVAMLVVIVAGLLATVARPARAGALLLGAAAVVGIHALELPMTSDRTTDAAAGSGTWLAIVAFVAFLIAAGVALAGPTPRDEPEPRPRESAERKPSRPVGKRGRRG
ncbi:MAG: hypothetical protein ACRDSK_25395 [Actinophytocola sp.]|uniref:hypothetical protein n=1 Tax=Actinophytocola sp. TaxID=1872138 RepID=UPI003D6BD3D2